MPTMSIEEEEKKMNLAVDGLIERDMNVSIDAHNAIQGLLISLEDSNISGQ